MVSADKWLISAAEMVVLQIATSSSVPLKYLKLAPAPTAHAPNLKGAVFERLVVPAVALEASNEPSI